ncbi:hypothetical protein FGADI_8762 [Fusarium gaditjirri]|uniref:F-box domain-containing protein n=1 Tax=Fusarium gaditjirri TaxID=282569 RepID=A0A8H4WTW7_9HYPO|nr:hypothetical protein FGADI_8762 [Fusarium gaditjirri]
MPLQQNSSTSASGSSSDLVPRNTLLGLPEELQALIVDIINEDDATNVDALCKLTLTCTHMNRIARSYIFHAANFRVFRRAVESAYVPMMRRCEEYGAAPVNITWPVRPLGRDYRPIDAVLLNLEERPDSRRSEQLQNRIRTSVYEAVMWLLEKGADAEASLASELLNGFRYSRLDMSLGHMPTRLLKQLQINIGRPAVEIYLEMIELLSSHGFPNPTRPSALDGVLATNVVPFHHSACDWADTHPYPFLDGAITETYLTESPIDLALKSHIPPRLLELMLKEYASRGVSLLTLYDECPEGLKKTCKGRSGGIDDDWVGVSSIGTLIGNLHADLHSTSVTCWKASYNGEVADIFRQKLDLMVKYEMVDVVEEALLKSILGALDSITTQMSATMRVLPWQFRSSWVTLCEAVRPYCADEYDLRHDINGTIARNGPGRVHEFAIDTKWNPWYMWFVWSDANRRLKLTRRKIGASEFSRNRRFFWHKRHGYEIEFILGYFDRTKVQPWYDVDVDEWCRQILETFTEDGVPIDLHDVFYSWRESKQGEYDEESISFEWWKQFTRT